MGHQTSKLEQTDNDSEQASGWKPICNGSGKASEFKKTGNDCGHASTSREKDTDQEPEQASESKQISNDFEHSGLSRLSTVDWKDERYRRSVIASLVKGVYVLKDDHLRHRKGKNALAPPWWESFGFNLLETYKDKCDWSIFGAAYEYIATSNNYHDFKTAPRYVIAFRGTSIKQDTVLRDMILNIEILVNKLHRRSRPKKAIQAVKKMVSEKGADHIWLAGHSLGAAIAMLAGKSLAKERIFLESYLYNPPFIAAPMEYIRSTMVKNGIFVSRSLITLCLAAMLQDDQERKRSENLFTTLSPWVPNLFLHPDDTICSGYISYFEQREMLESFGLENIGRLVTRHSWQGLFMNAIGEKYWSEELPLIPSANVTTSSCDFDPHRLSQWFKDDSVLDPKLYQYKADEVANLIEGANFLIENQKEPTAPSRDMQNFVSGMERANLPVATSGEGKTLVLFGRVGNGKSALGNSIFGKKEFVSKISASAVTTTCKLGTTRLDDGQVVNVIDTPGLFDLSRASDRPELYLANEVVNCMTLAKDGIHGFILVCSVKTQFSIKEEGFIHRLGKMFGEKFFDYMVVVFTGGDQLDTTFNEYISTCSSSLQTVLQLCKNRVLVFDNRTKDEVQRKNQVQQLMKFIEKIRDENRQPYKTEVFECTFSDTRVALQLYSRPT
ncbi:uncharacterized protein LOC113330166 isoform X1 [Papaver somniferum]|uniref:uncharacterized protein LOC113330166 isoform X1 n=1 Tax=Papaver somniferum TaxID=3469 RepID=UPI000E705DF7|nr:uncharacterized protein LOC113330166 isoform X1 [Papaver somniferum]